MTSHVTQHLVTSVVTEGVVEVFEVVYIHHRDRIEASHPRQRLVESSTTRKSGQFVVVCDPVRAFDDRYRERQASECNVKFSSRWPAKHQRDEHPEHARAYGICLEEE